MDSVQKRNNINSVDSNNITKLNVPATKLNNKQNGQQKNIREPTKKNVMDSTDVNTAKYNNNANNGSQIGQNSKASDELNDELEDNATLPPPKPSIFTRIKNKTKSAYSTFKKDISTPIEQMLNVNSAGMVPISQYRNELLEREKEILDTENVQQLSANNYELPAVELDEYLRGRYAIKAEEFKRLQREQGFYFSDTLDSQILERARINEGMYLIGVNINSLVDLYKHVVFKEPLLDENGNPIVIPGEGDILESGRSEDLVGEYYNEDYDKIYKDKMGFRLGHFRQLRPELVLRNNTPFDNIVRESAKYTGASYERISPKSLLNMIRILDEYSKYELQWLRSATAIEIIYKYLSNGMSRQQFFSSESRITEESILELEEFFKTDNIFMSLDELREFKHDLDFYRSEEHRNLISEKEKKKRSATIKLLNNIKNNNRNKLEMTKNKKQSSSNA